MSETRLRKSTDGGRATPRARRPVEDAAAPAKHDAPLAMQTRVRGAGDPIVLVPGGLTGWLSWEAHAERLSATRTVVQVQPLSVQYGLEDRPLGRDYSLRTESRAFAAALDGLGLAGPVDVVAWSFGAAVALDFALTRPDRLRSLVLIEPPALWVLRAEGPLTDAADKQHLAALDSLHADDVSEDQLERFVRAVGLAPPGASPRTLPQWPVWCAHRRSLRNTPAVLAHQDDVLHLDELQCPVLLVKGSGSAPFLHRIIDGLARRLPHADVVELPAGHAPQLVSLDRFLDRLREFHRFAFA